MNELSDLVIQLKKERCVSLTNHRASRHLAPEGLSSLPVTRVCAGVAQEHMKIESEESGAARGRHEREMLGLFARCAHQRPLGEQDKSIAHTQQWSEDQETKMRGTGHGSSAHKLLSSEQAQILMTQLLDKRCSTCGCWPFHRSHRDYRTVSYLHCDLGQQPNYS